MSTLVMKFGGTSVGSPERISQVVELIGRSRGDGDVAVIVSAMGDTTDRLIDAAVAAEAGDFVSASKILDNIGALAQDNAAGAARLIAERHNSTPADPADKVAALMLELRQLLYGVSLLRERSLQTMDLILSFGERLSATVVADLLHTAGMEGIYVDARDWTVTDDSFGDALVDWDATQAILNELKPTWQGKVPIVTGFLGRTPDGRTTTLGRNGSDYTATLLARGLGATEVLRWTDVSGVMTADPSIVKDAYPLDRLSYMEALELANFGARVFHPRTMIPLIESRIPMRIRNTMYPDGPCTIVDEAGRPDPAAATSVASLENLALIGVDWRSLAQQGAVGERVLHALAQADITVWMANQAAHGQALAVVVPANQVERAREVIEADLSAERARGDVQPLTVRSPMTMISLVAEAMGQTVNVAGRFFHAMGTLGIGIHACAQGASSRSISAVIDADGTHDAVRAVHAAFNFTHQEVNLLILGKGTVGGELIKQIRRQRESLERDPGVSVRVVGVLNSTGGVYNEEGLDLDSLDTSPQGEEAHPDQVLELLDRLQRLPVPMLVDCTAAENMNELYHEAFERGIHVITSNKKPLTGPSEEFTAVREAARNAHRSYLFETTVGASLPVIRTLLDIFRTGDWVHRIEGSFSGTLGYLINALNEGTLLHVALKDARKAGFTEPDPADDLRGLDVARKTLILARQLTIRVELSDVELEPFVPEEVLDAPDLWAALEAYAPVIAQQIEEGRKEGKVLRYLAEIVFENGGRHLKVGPRFVDASHPAARLRGTESFVAFTTDRYREYPLLVQGPGAGGAVTAAGVLADVLSVAQQLRGR